MGTEIIAHRAWGLVRREGVWLLQPVFNRTQTWLGPAVSAQGKPGSDDSVGIHAYKERILVEFEYPELPVIGTIQLYGHVWEHKFGYRAEKAIVRSLELNVVIDHDSRVKFLCAFETAKVFQRRGSRLHVVRFAQVADRPELSMSLITEAKIALEKRYQTDVLVNIEKEED